MCIYAHILCLHIFKHLDFVWLWGREDSPLPSLCTLRGHIFITLANSVNWVQKPDVNRRWLYALHGNKINLACNRNALWLLNRSFFIRKTFRWCRRNWTGSSGCFGPHFAPYTASTIFVRVNTNIFSIFLFIKDRSFVGHSLESGD